MQTILVVGVLAGLAYVVYRAGKREGSRKGFAVGRWRGGWRR